MQHAPSLYAKLASRTYQKGFTIMVCAIEYPEPVKHNTWLNATTEVESKMNLDTHGGKVYSPHDTTHAFAYNCMPGCRSVKGQALIRDFMTMVTPWSRK